MTPSRAQLLGWWAAFVVAWCAAALLLVGPIQHLACESENLELEEGSAKERYCDALHDFLESGEPSEWTTPLPWLTPVAVLAVIGSYGVRRRSRRFLSRAAAVAAAALVVHLLLVLLLPG